MEAWLTLGGVLIVALIVAVTADRRLEKTLAAERTRLDDQLRAEDERHRRDLRHQREMADLAEVRAFFESIAGVMETAMTRAKSLRVMLQRLEHEATSVHACAQPQNSPEDCADGGIL